ncbi:unnamed protein product [Coffea canephora]|uniref:Uncharacterized protein n=1 Tax=Coffea canephora TaxID=49390 RepID=A0A068UX78_COFCA|nr:unnamed protein product [Coffea canephora]
MRIRGIEPRSVPWEGTMIPLHQMRDVGSLNLQILLEQVNEIISKATYYWRVRGRWAVHSKAMGGGGARVYALL